MYLVSGSSLFYGWFKKNMDSIKGTVEIYDLDEYNYPKFRGQLIGLYLHAFTTGDYSQHIDRETVEVTLDDILQDGSGCMAFVGNRLVGLLAAFPLKRDPDFPADTCRDIPVGEAIYIAEIMVHADYRGRRIASKMLNTYLQEKSKNYSYAVIRVWEKNIPALELYKKLGFLPVATISQQKLSIDKEEFVMWKVYLVKKIRS